MKVIKKTLIKQVITEKSKRKLEYKFKQKKAKLNLECEQLIFEKKKLQKEKKNATHKIAKHFQTEIDKKKRSINQLNFKIEQLHQLPLGSEIVENTIESIVEVSVGMNWTDFLAETTIIIEDDIVVRIDNE